MGECLPLAYFLLIIIIFALLPKKKSKGAFVVIRYSKGGEISNPLWRTTKQCLPIRIYVSYVYVAICSPIFKIAGELINLVVPCMAYQHEIEAGSLKVFICYCFNLSL